MIQIANSLLEYLPSNSHDEISEVLAYGHGVRIERIISTGQCSPEGFWYDQDEHEFVVVINGEAELEFETHRIRLAAGDYLTIPAHQQHRVAWTDPEQTTVWLAVFYNE